MFLLWCKVILHSDQEGMSSDWLMIRSAWSDYSDRMVMPSVNAAYVVGHEKAKWTEDVPSQSP